MKNKYIDAFRNKFFLFLQVKLGIFVFWYGNIGEENYRDNYSLHNKDFRENSLVFSAI